MSDEPGVKCTVTIKFLDNGETDVIVDSPDGINNMRIDKATKRVRREFRRRRGQIRFEEKARLRLIKKEEEEVKQDLPPVLVGETQEMSDDELDAFLSFDEVHGNGDGDKAA